MRQYQDGGRQLILDGKLEEGRMHVQIDGGRIDRRLGWGDDVVGFAGRQRLFRDRKPKPGDQFTYPTYEPTFNAVVLVRATVKEPESIQVAGVARKLLPIRLTPDKLDSRGVKFQPPGETVWLDDDFNIARREIELDGLGSVLLTPTTRQAALAPAPATPAADLGLRSLIPLDRRIPRAYATTSAVYRVTLRGDSDPARALASDSHQEVRLIRAGLLEIKVHPTRPKRELGVEPEPGPEFLGSSYYLDADDKRIRELARDAAAGEKDAWAKALRIERWVKSKMRPDNAAPLAPASKVARDLRGDCRSYAFLTTALCRAEGLPARTAVGLLYVEKSAAPSLGFHMWTEVYVRGRWLGLDGTLGLGGVSAAHLKVADHSWHEMQSLVPFLPVTRLLSKISVEVASVE
jgi:hypothetical protein